MIGSFVLPSATMVLAAEVAETWGEHASLWAIRLAMIAMFVTFAMQLLGSSEVSNRVRSLWLFGAVAALAHSLGALFAFHAGSHQEAFDSTAKQTEELLGVAVGIGLYVNYVFVFVWLGDACFRWFGRNVYSGLPRWYRPVMYGFLGFIAVNGTVVFKSGSIRWIAVGAIVALGCLWWRQIQQQTRSSAG